VGVGGGAGGGGARRPPPPPHPPPPPTPNPQSPNLLNNKLKLELIILNLIKIISF